MSVSTPTKMGPARRGMGPGAPPAESQSAAAPADPNAPDRFAISSGKVGGAQRVVIYGTGGVGKSTLASLAPNAAFLDVEGSTRELDVKRVGDIGNIETWADLRAIVQSSRLDGFASIVIDTLTKAEEMAVTHTLATVLTERSTKATSVESYGFGKGLQHVYDTFLLLLSDLDRHIRAGRNVILVAHQCVADVPNPASENFIRYEPRLQTTKKGSASIRSRVIEWADHVLFIGYDVIAKDGKGAGGGTRTIYADEMPDHIAKSRRKIDPRPYENETDGSVWPLILGGAK